MLFDICLLSNIISDRKDVVLMKAANGYGSIVKLSGKRRRPYMIRITQGYDIGEKTGRKKQLFKIIGYAKTKKEAESMLKIYHENDKFKINYTFADVYRMWSKEGLADVSKSYISAIHVAYQSFESIHNKEFALLHIVDIQVEIDNSGKNYPTLRKLKLLLSLMYKYAIRNGICSKDISGLVNINKYMGSNFHRINDSIIRNKDIDILWSKSKNEYVQMILILIYTGVHINELLNIKKEDIYLVDRYIKIVGPKSNKLLRIVPISKKILPFIESRLSKYNESKYLFTTDKGNRFEYRDFRDACFNPVMNDLEMSYTLQYCRATFRRLLVQGGVKPFLIKKIIGSMQGMTLTERVYIHLEIQSLAESIDKV